MENFSIVPALELCPLLNITRTSRCLKKIVHVGTNNAFTVFTLQLLIIDVKLDNKQTRYLVVGSCDQLMLFYHLLIKAFGR